MLKLFQLKMSIVYQRFTFLQLIPSLQIKMRTIERITSSFHQSTENLSLYSTLRKIHAPFTHIKEKMRKRSKKQKRNGKTIRRYARKVLVYGFNFLLSSFAARYKWGFYLNPLESISILVYARRIHYSIFKYDGNVNMLDGGKKSFHFENGKKCLSVYLYETHGDF